VSTADRVYSVMCWTCHGLNTGIKFNGQVVSQDHKQVWSRYSEAIGS